MLPIDPRQQQMFACRASTPDITSVDKLLHKSAQLASKLGMQDLSRRMAGKSYVKI